MGFPGTSQILLPLKLLASSLVFSFSSAIALSIVFDPKSPLNLKLHSISFDRINLFTYYKRFEALPWKSPLSYKVLTVWILEPIISLHCLTAESDVVSFEYFSTVHIDVYKMNSINQWSYRY